MNFLYSSTTPIPHTANLFGIKEVQEDRQKNQIKQGFSIAEMSVVIAIIAILLTSILAGKGIIRNFRLANATKLTHNSPISEIYNERGEQSVKIWFEATNLASFEFSSNTAATIQSWYDISGNGNHISQTTTSLYPTYLPDAINNLPAIEFAAGGSTKHLDGKGGLAMLDDTYSMAIVWMTHEVDGGNDNALFYIGKNTNSHGTMISLALRGGDDFEYTADVPGNKVTLVSSITTNTPYATVVVKNNAEISAWHNHLTFNDAAAVNNSSTNAIPEKLIVGDSAAESDAEFDGYIGELIIFDKALTDTEAENVLDYLGSKWQIRTN